MPKIPKRSDVAQIYRKVLVGFEKYLIFPIKNPNFYQIFSLIVSTLFLFVVGTELRALLVLSVLVADWLDGAVARRYKLANRQGWLIDVVVDRVSEGFIFAAVLFTGVGKAFFALYLVNIVLSMYSIKSQKHLILPLRFFYLIFLVYILVTKYFLEGIICLV